MSQDLEKEARELFGEPVSAGAPPTPPADLEGEATRLFTDTASTEAGMTDERARQDQLGNVVSEPDALRHAEVVAPAYWAMPKPLRAMLTVSPHMQDELAKFRNRATNIVELTGGSLAYWASRPQAAMFKKASELYQHFPGGAAAYERLNATLPETGDEHAKEVPSMALHDQLDDVNAAASPGVSWIDKEPQAMERMSRDVNAEHLYVETVFGGDWDAYQKTLDAMPMRDKIATKGDILAANIILDPMWMIDKPLKALAMVPKGIKMIDVALAARKIGVPAKEVAGAAETISKVHGPIGELMDHVASLETKLDGMVDQAGSVSHQRVHKRLLEAKAELAAREAESAAPKVIPYLSPKRNPQTIYVPQRIMAPEELVVRQDLAEQAASVGDVEHALTKEGLGKIQDVVKKTDDVYVAAARGDVTAEQVDHLRALDRLPDAVKEHLDALGISSDRVLHAAAVARGESVPITNLTSPEAAAARAFMGADDVEEAGRGLAHMRDGGDAADLTFHNVDALEHSVIQNNGADGIMLMDTPDYRSRRVGGIREMSRRDALTHLLGRYVQPGLGVGSTHVDAPALVKAVQGAGKRLAFGASRFLPLSASTFAPEVAAVHDLASKNYHLYVNEGQNVLKRALSASGLAERTKIGTYQAVKGAEKQLDNVVEMLNTAVDPVTGTSSKLEQLIAKSPENQVQLYRSIRSYLDAQATRLKLDRGGAISGYFPHVFPEADRRVSQRALEFLGVNKKAFVSFFALKHRSGAEGWSRDLIHTMDLYNRGAARKIVMEPAYQRIVELTDAYKAAGRNQEANYANAFLLDARGMAGPSLFSRAADVMGTSPGTRDKVEWVVTKATELFYKSLLGGNLNYGLQNMAGGTTNMLAEHGPFSLIQGLLQFATPEGRAMAERSGVYKQALHSLSHETTLSGKTLSSNLPRSANKALESAYNAMDVGQRTEYLLRGLSVNTALGEQVRRSGKTWAEIKAAGLDEAFIKEAARITDRTQHVFGPTGRSPYLHTLLGHTGYQATIQLGTYPYKQTEFILKSMSKDPGFIVRYLTYSGIMAHMAAETLGVATGPAVGFGYADSITNPRKGRIVSYSPGLEWISSSIDLFKAWRSGDPAEIEKAQGALWRATEAGAFGVNQFERYARNMREAFAGKKEKFQDRAPFRDVVAQLRAGNPEVKHAERPLQGGERVLHALGVQTVQDRVAQVTKDQKRQHRFDRQRRLMDARKQRANTLKDYEGALDGYTQALIKGDGATAHAIYERESAAGRMRFSPDTGQALREAEFLRARLRFLRKAPGFMPAGRFVP